MNKKTRIALCLGALSMGLLLDPSVYAANPYGMDYTGGELLSSDNVQIDSELTSGLTPLIKYSNDNQIGTSSSSLWKDGYEKTSTKCRKVKYFTIWDNNQITDDDFYYTISNEQYSIKVNIEDVVLSGTTGTSANNAFVITIPPHGAIQVSSGYAIYSDSECQNQLQGVRSLTHSDDGFVFIKTKINLYDKFQNIVKTNNLYFGITDIDYAQSTKILNDDSSLIPSNMYAVSANILQPTDTTLRNMYVPSEKYIYSQYDDSGVIMTNESTNIFAKVGLESQEAGLDVIFGYKSAAGSGVQYYAKQYLVEYVSDENGVIDGITEEDIISTNNPSGSSSDPNDDYEFVYWTADKDVVLEDGEEIEAGDPLTPEQVKQVVVNENLVFTAHHETTAEDIVVPDTGRFTGETNATIITLSVAGLSFGALVVFFTPRLLRRKVSFKNKK